MLKASSGREENAIMTVKTNGLKPKLIHYDAESFYVVMPIKDESECDKEHNQGEKSNSDQSKERTK